MSAEVIWPVRWDWLKIERTRAPIVQVVEDGELEVDPRAMMVPHMSEQGTSGGEDDDWEIEAWCPYRPIHTVVIS
jgi:hypothetical protein